MAVLFASRVVVADCVSTHGCVHAYLSTVMSCIKDGLVCVYAGTRGLHVL